MWWDGVAAFVVGALSLLLAEVPLIDASDVRALEQTDARSAPFLEGQPPRIQWFGRLADGLAEARRSGRPILISSASPSCDGVPGKW